MNFQPGDVVYLKSGGPLMTVVKFSADGEIQCMWFNEDGKSYTPHTYYFVAALLAKSQQST